MSQLNGIGARIGGVCMAGMLWISGCASPPPPADGREGTSLLGMALRSPAPSAKQEAEIAAAREAYEATPTEATAIALGRKLSSAGMYREAVEHYGAALQKFPKSYRILRHRGHRLITLRRFEEATNDLSRAWSLAKDPPDAPEGDPATSRSTDKMAILYHWGLAHCLRGDYVRCVEVFRMRNGLEGFNDDNRVSSMHWEYLALRRTGREAEARKLVASVREGMDVRENQSYYILCKMYAGLITPAQAAAESERAGGGQSASVGVRYGLACWAWFAEDDRSRAMAEFEAIVNDRPETQWANFGFIAAEAELARQCGALACGPAQLFVIRIGCPDPRRVRREWKGIQINRPASVTRTRPLRAAPPHPPRRSKPRRSGAPSNRHQSNQSFAFSRCGTYSSVT